MVHMLANCPGSYEGSLNTSVPDDLGGECAEEGLSLVSRSAESGNLFTVAHHGKVGASGWGAGCDVGLGGGEGCSIEGTGDSCGGTWVWLWVYIDNKWV